MKRVHYTDSYLMNPQHPVTVNIIGAGGTGSQVLTCMARLDVTLRALGHPGLFVTLYDPDIVTDANIGRQLFGCSDLGLNKAQCLITRVNNFFGNDWKAVPDIFPTVLKDARRDDMAQVIINELDAIKDRYRQRRRTQITNAGEAVYVEKKIEEMDIVFLMDRFGYARTIDMPTYERNKEAADAENRYAFVCKNRSRRLAYPSFFSVLSELWV